MVEVIEILIGFLWWQLFCVAISSFTDPRHVTYSEYMDCIFFTEIKTENHIQQSKVECLSRMRYGVDQIETTDDFRVANDMTVQRPHQNRGFRFQINIFSQITPGVMDLRLLVSYRTS